MLQGVGRCHKRCMLLFFQRQQGVYAGNQQYDRPGEDGCYFTTGWSAHQCMVTVSILLFRGGTFRSNYYPCGSEKSRRGNCKSCFWGWSKYVVDGGLTLRCPYHPKPSVCCRPVRWKLLFVETQTQFYTLDLKNMGHNFSLDDGFNFVEASGRKS